MGQALTVGGLNVLTRFISRSLQKLEDNYENKGSKYQKIKFIVPKTGSVINNKYLLLQSKTICQKFESINHLQLNWDLEYNRYSYHVYKYIIHYYLTILMPSNYFETLHLLKQLQQLKESFSTFLRGL